MLVEKLHDFKEYIIYLSCYVFFHCAYVCVFDYLHSLSLQIQKLPLVVQEFHCAYVCVCLTICIA